MVKESTLKRIFAFAYGVTSYTLGSATLAYAIGFIGNLLVPKSIDSPAQGPWPSNLAIDAALLAVFAVQHSGMARQGFKRWITRYISPVIERSTYVLASAVALSLLMWQWRPLGGTVWTVTAPAGRGVLYFAYAMGWVLVFTATFVINHFDLFGLRQVWRHLLGREQRALHFVTP
ncbi:MAG: isoprenylcysteine carboxylmethyltransferase family protein, partial [Proteobacteria bacterium]|nr:isoprenylcysteine carboxylmethyltransferase family protein [Pseudomonadota bacterium]